MNNKGSLAGLREACQADMLARVAGMSDKQKLQAWNRARNIATTTLKAIRGDIMKNRAENFKTIKDIYYRTAEEFSQGLIGDDWEQEFFDKIEIMFNTDKQKALVNLFYRDDDDIITVADGLLSTLRQKTLLESYYFETFSNDLVVVNIVKK